MPALLRKAIQRTDSCLAYAHCGTHIRLKEHRKEGEKKTSPFLKAIKQSAVKSVRQHSAVKKHVTGSKAPIDPEDGLENRACLQQGTYSQKWEVEVASQGIYKGLGNACNPECHCLTGHRIDGKGKIHAVK